MTLPGSPGELAANAGEDAEGSGGRRTTGDADLPTYNFTEPRVGYRMEEGEA